MQLKQTDKLELPASGDFHVHLRDGAMMETVVPTIRQGGVDVVYVMVGANWNQVERAIVKTTSVLRCGVLPPTS